MLWLLNSKLHDDISFTAVGWFQIHGKILRRSLLLSAYDTKITDHNVVITSQCFTPTAIKHLKAPHIWTYTDVICNTQPQLTFLYKTRKNKKVQSGLKLRLFQIKQTPFYLQIFHEIVKVSSFLENSFRVWVVMRENHELSRQGGHAGGAGQVRDGRVPHDHSAETGGHDAEYVQSIVILIEQGFAVIVFQPNHIHVEHDGVTTNGFVGWGLRFNVLLCLIAPPHNGRVCLNHFVFSAKIYFLRICWVKNWWGKHVKKTNDIFDYVMPGFLKVF